MGSVYYTHRYRGILSGKENNADTKEKMKEWGELTTQFSRVLAQLRKERGISQRAAAAELGISQALMSHYENGIREPGLDFLRRVCEFYDVSADYLLGRTLSRDGTTIAAEDIYDSSEEKGNVLRGSMLALLQKKLLVNTTSMLFDLLGKTGNRDVVNAAAAYLGGALYSIHRLLYRAGGNQETYQSVQNSVFNAGIIDADMQISRARFAAALEEAAKDTAFPPMGHDELKAAYPGLHQSALQVFHSVSDRVAEMLGSYALHVRQKGK